MRILSRYTQRAARPHPVAAFALAPRFPGEVQLILDTRGRVTFASASLEGTLGRRPDDARGKELAKLVHPSDEDGYRRLWNDVRARPDTQVSTEWRLRHADGSWHTFEVMVEGRTADPEIGGVVVALHDISEQRRAERALDRAAARLRALAGNLSEVILTVDDEFTVRDIGTNVLATFGHAKQDVEGTSLIDHLHPADRFSTMVALEELLAGAPLNGIVARVSHANGHWVPTEIEVNDLRDNRLVGAIGITLRDVSGRVVAERERDRLNAIMWATPDIVTMVGRDGSLLYANVAAVDFLRTGETNHDPRAEMPPWAAERYETEALPVLRENGTWQGELALMKEGREIPLSCVLVAHRDDDGRIASVSAISRDISENKVFEQRLRHQASHDDLTGLPNRVLLMDRLEMALARTARLETGVAVLFCDIDRFKVVNDSLGHAVGDDLLKQVGDRLAQSVRPGDTVARFGGDEFVLLCSDLTSPRDAVVLSDRVQAAVREPLMAGGSELVVTLSIGIAYDERGMSQPNALVRDADAAMYRAKAKGRDRAEVFDEALRRRALDRLDTESGLRRAIDDGRLVVHYQPVIDLRDDRVSGFEALMRWDHPERGLLAPAAFMEVAEETGLIVPLGRHLFAEACHQTVAWQGGQAGGELNVFVNFSAAQLRHATVVHDVAIVLEETGIDPACVQVEVTEHVLLDDEDVAVGQISALKDLGLKIVIDDFGTGYSSLSYLQRFPVDLLKVDRSFVSGVTRGEGDAAIVRGVIDLAHRLGLSAVAEGVEHSEQVEVLRDLGCERAQGFLLGRPATAPTQTAFLATQPAPGRRFGPSGKGDNAGAGAA